MVALDPESDARLDAFADPLVAALRRAGWSGSEQAICNYCCGLLLPGERKSMEPIAARLDPWHTQACYASIQRLITDSEWDSQVVLDESRAYALPFLTSRGRIEAWIGDDTSYPKQGRNSVGNGRSPWTSSISSWRKGWRGPPSWGTPVTGKFPIFGGG